MARSLTTRDIHELMNALVAQATGQSDIAVVDASSFVSAGELVMATGTENVLNSLSLLIGRTLVATRPYKAPLSIINSINTGMYTDRLRKISFYAKESLASGAFNTQLFTNLAQDFDNSENGVDAITGDPKSTKSMWVQNQAMPLEMNFAGSSTWQDSITIYEWQLKKAFTDEASFGEFVSGIMQEKANDIESQKEAFNRLAVLNHIAATYDLDAADANGRVINLTKAYNDRFGTSYTSEQLRSTYLKEFLAFFVSTFKNVSDFMRTRSKKYHWAVEKTVGSDKYYILRHTPYDKQRVILYQPLFREAEALVLPEIFRPEYLNINTQYEGVNFWQSFEDGAAIDFFPAIPQASGTQTKGNEVKLDYVVGMIYDVDGLMIDYQLEDVSTSPLEARKHYRNTWYTFCKNIISDATENCVIFTMEDPATNTNVSEGRSKKA